MHVYDAYLYALQVAAYMISQLVSACNYLMWTKVQATQSSVAYASYMICMQICITIYLCVVV